MNRTCAILAVALLGAAPAVVFAAPASAPATFVAKAGASDMFEIESAKLMTSSTNPAIKAFATKMIADHTKSTSDVKMAAKADHMSPKPPSLSIKQRADLTALKATSGKMRDSLYVKQQKPAHADALALMQGYSADGTAKHLKMAATKISPVVESHAAMLDKMPAM